jgi:hypothetical protein
MVQAIMDGRKSMTRRVVNNAEVNGHAADISTANSVTSDGTISGWTAIFYNAECASRIGYAPYRHLPDDILYVRETWMPETEQGIPTGGYIYKAGSKPEPDGDTPLKWRPSLFMPKEAARIFLRITDVRVKRLQDITEEDARDEGVGDPYDYQAPEYYEQPHMRGIGYFASAFAGLWDSLNSKRGYGWDTNPWVWVYSFERCGKGA